ncbi:hypothetical protein HDU96_001532 [Phlyctochytrium bullatum]|nr:hypothetical protein HDU96_001532 [Phlyctochytrium bullatum]
MDSTNIWIAASDGDLDTVKAFVEAGIHPNTKDENGYTAIHAAASYGHIGLLEYLLANGGDPNVTDNDGDTPLFFSEIASIANCLLQHGADATIRNHDGYLAIETASEEERDEVVELLQNITPEFRRPTVESTEADLEHVLANDGETIVLNLDAIQQLAASGALAELMDGDGGEDDALR